MPFSLNQIPKVVLLLSLTFGLNLILTSAAMGHELNIASNQAPVHLFQNEAQTQAFILLTKSDKVQLAQIKEFIEVNHGQTIHILPYQALIASVSQGTLAQLANVPGVSGIYTQAVELAAMDSYGSQVRHFASAWNSLLAPPTSISNMNLMTQTHAEESQDAFVAPDVPMGRQNASGNNAITPGYYQTSEYMTGSVAVGIVLVESNGSTDPSSEDWTVAEKQLVFNEMMAAFNWWAKLEPRANLSFIYEDHFSNPLPTTVEPITRPFTDQQYWINDAMSSLGYNTSSYFNRVRDYNNALRAVYETDWAFTVFVVDSSNDKDHRFSDGLFAYAYLGGPFMVLTYGNNGYGPANMDAVAAHEMGHIFYALDQYSSARQSCTNSSGYLNIENQNSQFGSCSTNVNSIMRGQITPYTVGAIDPYAAGQIGWRDSDQDNIFDPLDVQLTISLDNIINSNQRVTASGSAKISPYPSPNHKSVTINKITSVKYRFNYGQWQQGIPGDGTFDNSTEDYSFTSPALGAGFYLLEVAAFDSAGNISSNFASNNVLIQDPNDPGPNTEFYELESPITSHSLNISGLAYHAQGGHISQVQYRINSGSWQLAQPQDGLFDSDYEPFELPLGTVQPGIYTIETFATDNNGKTEVNFANKVFQIGQATSANIFLPIVTTGM